jgi:DNA-binding IclR family transcriptional regulator
MQENNHKVHAVEKAVALLDCFWREKKPLSLTELFAYDRVAKEHRA